MMRATKFLSRGWRLALAACLAALGQASTARADLVLGQAGDYTVLGLTGSKISITNAQTDIWGNLGLGPTGIQNFSDGAIHGNYVVDPTANNTKSNNVVVTGSRLTQDLSQAVSDALSASSAAGALSATQTFTSITGPTSINGNGGQNVIRLTGDLNLSGTNNLTLHGGASDFFVFDVSGKWAQSGSSQIVLDGVSVDHVLINMLGAGGDVALSGDSFLRGTMLAVDRNISISGAFVDGALIGARNGKQIALTSGADINGTPPSVPEPASLALFAGGVALMLFPRRKRDAAAVAAA